jgi:hypothetical protein
MNSWQRAMASSPSIAATSVRAAMNMSPSRRVSSAALTFASICSTGMTCLPGDNRSGSEHLVADEQAGDARRLEGAHHLPHVVDTAKAGVGIDVDGQLDRCADARIVVGIVAHVGLAHVRLRQHAADRA